MEKRAKIKIVLEVEGCTEIKEVVLDINPPRLIGLREKDMDGLAFAFNHWIRQALKEIGECQKAEEIVMDKLGVDIDKAREIIKIMEGSN
jgi:hypothetical protein